MYVFLVYGGVITLFLLLSLLVIKFDQRLSHIQQNALNNTQIQINSNLNLNDTERIAYLEYFSLILDLPHGFPIPAWFNILLSARSAALFFEVIKITSPKSNVTKILQKILEK